MTTKKAQKKLNQMFKRDFENLIELGVDPRCGDYTIYGDISEGYKKYAKNRMAQIEAGKDEMYELFRKFIDVIRKR